MAHNQASLASAMTAALLTSTAMARGNLSSWCGPKLILHDLETVVNTHFTLDWESATGGHELNMTFL